LTPTVSHILLTTNGASSTDNYFETPADSITGTDHLVSNTTLASILTTSTIGVAIADTTVSIDGIDKFGGTVSATNNADGFVYNIARDRSFLGR
jgi:hypothetical protein